MHEDLIWHNSIFPPPDGAKIGESLPTSLARIASQSPDATAVLCNGKTYSFHDLASRVAGLAAEIIEASNDRGPVALVLSESFDSIAAWFACSLSGRPFVLLEPDHPPLRLLELIENAGCTLVLGDSTTSKVLFDLPIANLLLSAGRMGSLSVNGGLSADEPAMIFPTSGSTGKPKLITYAAVTLQVKVHSSMQLMRVPSGARVLIAGSHGNYGFLHHALVFLLSGGSICLADIKIGGFDAVVYAITQLGARHVRFTPSLFRTFALLPQAKEALRLLEGVRFSGEPLLAHDLEFAQTILDPKCLIQNVYGSTESALFIWSNDVDDIPLGTPTVPIGRIYPLSSYAIQSQNNEQDADTGELLIRSKYHALGDFNGVVIDKERFPECDGFGEDRIYATGDIVRQIADGNLVHLGRIGRMVKIRGNRVYLTEIENHLRAIPGVTDAAVIELTRQDRTVLFGFVCTDTTTIESDVAHAWLTSRLPDYMIPLGLESISQLPLLAGGKVDYQALINLVPTRYTAASSNSSMDGDYLKLTQLWDSLLWPGAHEHDSDFFALGGDSHNLMMLSVEIERIFGKNLPIDELLVNGTLRKLADILGLESPHSRGDIQFEKIRVKLFRQSNLPSKGIAIAVPGYGGWATAEQFIQAGMFDDHDVWVADFPINDGSMLEANRWWNAALEIVDGIRKGTIPTARVIFGYSFGGGLAWLIGRLLSGIPQCPEFVVMVDAAPIHRLPNFHSASLTEALTSVSHLRPPPSIDIRRAPLLINGNGKRNTANRDHEDNIQVIVNLPTVDHQEMIRWDMLALAREAVASFLNHDDLSHEVMPTLQPPGLFGVNFYRAINGCHNSYQKVKDDLSSSGAINNYNNFIGFVFAALSMNDYEKALQLIRDGVKKWPYSRKLHYLNLRLHRGAGYFLLDKCPTIYPPSIVECENSLAKSTKTIDQPRARTIKLVYLSLDVLIAFIMAESSKWTRNYSRVM